MVEYQTDLEIFHRRVGDHAPREWDERKKQRKMSTNSPRARILGVVKWEIDVK